MGASESCAYGRNMVGEAEHPPLNPANRPQSPQSSSGLPTCPKAIASPIGSDQARTSWPSIRSGSRLPASRSHRHSVNSLPRFSGYAKSRKKTGRHGSPRRRTEFADVSIPFPAEPVGGTLTAERRYVGRTADATSGRRASRDVVSRKNRRASDRHTPGREELTCTVRTVPDRIPDHRLQPKETMEHSPAPSSSTLAKTT